MLLVMNWAIDPFDFITPTDGGKKCNTHARRLIIPVQIK